jgi:hypothetical protein
MIGLEQNSIYTTLSEAKDQSSFLTRVNFSIVLRQLLNQDGHWSKFQPTEPQITYQDMIDLYSENATNQDS